MNPQTTEKFDVLVVGATGYLGCYITRHLLTKPNLRVHALIRNRQKDKDLVERVEKSGGRIIVGDVNNPDSYSSSLKGIHTVISAISSPNDPRIFVDPQITLVRECIKNGVERFVPSDFGVNYTKFSREEVNRFVLAKGKLEFDDWVKNQPIKTLHFWPGRFIELFFMLHPKGLEYWGDGNFKFDFTSYEDMARFVAAAVSKRDQTGHLVFVANELSMNDVSEIYNKVRGTKITPKRLGSLDDLRQRYESKIKSGEQSEAISLGSELVLSDPRSKFDKTNNSEFPEVKRTSLEDLLREKPELKLQ